MELRHIRIFIAVAEELHFTQAAERLVVAQPVVSRAIAELEGELGVTLLTRSTRSVKLTNAGLIFLGECRKVMQQLEKAVTVTRRADVEKAGLLRIGYTEFAINGGLPKVVRDFSTAYPHVKLELTFMSTLEQRAALMRGEIDAGFMQGIFDHPACHNRLFQHDELMLIMADQHPMASRAEISLSELQDEPFVFGDVKIWGAFREAVFNSCRIRGFIPRVVQEANNGEGIVGLVAAGVGMSIFATTKDRVTSRTDVRSVRIKETLDPLATFYVWPADATSPYLDSFGQFVPVHTPGLQARSLD